MPSRGRTAGRRRSRPAVTFVASLAALFLIVSAGVGYVLFVQVRDLVAGSGFLPNLFDEEGGGPGDPDAALVWEPWTGTERVNVLVLGVDERESEDGPWRTDTMILLTVDPLSMTGGMLSIPRDLWVPIPPYGEGRINTAHYLGDLYNYPGGGPALARDTVRHNFGVPVHYYVRLNFRAFVDLVDLIDGIDIYVQEEIDDPTYPSSNPADPYGFEPLHIPAGWVHMDGELALRYARTRHSSGGDFDRADRQQQVLRAVLERVVQLDMLPRLVAAAPGMWEEHHDSVVTDLTLDQIMALGNLAAQIPPESIRAGVIDERYTMFWETPDGQQVLIPLRDRIRELRDELFTSGPPPSAESETDRAARVAEEAATVNVLNGTLMSGLAQSTAERLQGEGIQVVGFGNADRADYTESLIYVYTGKTFTAEAIADILMLPPTAVVPISDASVDVDIVVILGADYEESP